MKKIGKYLNIEFVKCEFSPYGIKIPNNKNVDLYGTDQFKEGHFEVQDEASQIAALQVQCRPGDLVLDFCSGSGGKSLAISHLLEGKGQIYLHDPRESTLLNAKKRFHRAGATNVQFHSNESSLSKIIKNKADWIILDVPCTGTGTIRRNPDIKFRFSP
jgi:16S rRNA (cytosine967-C5)-methyltransferase